MAHKQKFSMANVSGLLRHCERKNKNYGNEDIDKSKSAENYDLIDRNNSFDYLKQRLSEISVYNRSDVVVLVDWIVTKPKEFDGDERKFFEETVNFLNDRYGEKNAVFAIVHKDEKTPHLHYSFVPATPDKKHPDREKCSAKEVITRGDLLTFHPDLSKHLERVFGYDVGIENGATKDGHFDIPELKAATAELTKIKAEIDNAKKEKSALPSEKFKEQLIDKYGDATFLNKLKNFTKHYVDSDVVKIPMAELSVITSVADQAENFQREVGDLQEQLNAATKKLIVERQAADNRRIATERDAERSIAAAKSNTEAAERQARVSKRAFDMLNDDLAKKRELLEVIAIRSEPALTDAKNFIAEREREAAERERFEEAKKTAEAKAAADEIAKREAVTRNINTFEFCFSGSASGMSREKIVEFFGKPDGKNWVDEVSEQLSVDYFKSLKLSASEAKFRGDSFKKTCVSLLNKEFAAELTSVQRPPARLERERKIEPERGRDAGMSM
ncbi:hypothetical protein AGMMS49959_18410 [Planctomycetales bacterium]|nr:hypothetical protein AGMMS49959_18410 [Planctomycetales bacterium]